jgi:multicomponent Na+:H+ antiporter subunit G
VSVATAVAVGVLLAVGLLFLLGGTLGLVRLPDLYARAHATSKCDTVGAGSILIALALLGGLTAADLKLLLLAGLVAVTGPTTAHVLVRSAHRRGLDAWRRPPGGPR